MATIILEKGDVVHNSAGTVGIALSKYSVLVIYKHQEGKTGRLLDLISPDLLNHPVPMLPAERDLLSREKKVIIDAVLMALDLPEKFNLKTE